jgi:hypothetical protein
LPLKITSFLCNKPPILFLLITASGDNANASVSRQYQAFSIVVAY